MRPRIADELSALVANVRLLSLDAGGVIIFLHHDRVARFATERGFPVTGSKLRETEGQAKRMLETGGLLDADFPAHDAPGAGGWGRVIGTTLHLAGIPADAIAGPQGLLAGLWESHVAHNLYSQVPAGFGEAVDAVRALGIPAVVVSNSEGMLEPFLDQIGVRKHLDRIIDSGLAGVEKPDPRIFEIALMQSGTRIDPKNALHLGDTFATDVAGAYAAKMRCGLVDPFDHYAGLHLDVPRVPGVVEVCHAIVASHCGH